MNEMHLLLVQVYCDLLPKIRETAKELGYAIAVHGSLTRDFDLVAIPWTEDACDDITLVEAIISTISLTEINRLHSICPEAKPHGRKAYAILIGCGMYIDLSVMPFLDKILSEEE